MADQWEYRTAEAASSSIAQGGAYRRRSSRPLTRITPRGLTSASSAVTVIHLRRKVGWSDSAHVRSAVDRGCRRVLLVADVVAPGRGVALVVDLEHRDVGHEARRRRAVPVLLARLEEHAVAGPDDLDGPAAPLAQADALEDPDRLTVRVRVPGGARAGREVDAARAQRASRSDGTATGST